MPWQLIFTSVPRGLTPGQSGYCTVARSKEMREGLVSRLEKLSYYHPTSDGEVILAYRILELRGSRYHVLTRIGDAGLDFTKRRKFLAHHLVFLPEELPVESPARIFSNWPDWKKRWEGDPIWIEITPGFETRGGFNDSWAVTFTTRIQEGDNAGDFQHIWREGEELPAPKAKLTIPEAPATAEKTATAPIAAESPQRFPWAIYFGGATAAGLGLVLFLLPRESSESKASNPSPAPAKKVAPSPAPGFGRVFGNPEELLKEPVKYLPPGFVLIDAKAEMASLAPELARRLREIALPAGGSLALRPEKDFVAKIAEEFGLLPALEFDLGAIRSQVEQVIADKEKSVRAMEKELAELQAKEKELVTSARTTEEVQRSDRIAALKLAAPKAAKELEELRKKGALVPNQMKQIGTFSVFLCRKNWTQEIIRFDEGPELLRVVSP
jgi:hypothetical protein